MDIVGDVITRACAATDIASKLPDYGGLPAVFRPDTVPLNDPPYPHLIASLVTSQNDDSSDEAGYRIGVDIRGFDRLGQSRDTTNIEALMSAVTKTFNRRGFPMVSGTLVMVRAGQPFETPTSGPDIIGRRVAVVITAKEYDP